VDELCRCARLGIQAEVERLLEAGAPVEGRSTATGLTALAEAVTHNEDALVRYLVDDCEADVHTLGADGRPILFALLSCEERDGSEMLRFLLSRGAGNTLSAEEYTAAAAEARFPVMRYWLQLSRDITPPTPAEQADLASVGLARLHGLQYSCIGQFAAKKTISAAIRRWKYFAPARPLVLVLAGPAGHGKSVMGKALAQALGIGSTDCATDPDSGFCVVDLGQLGSAEALLGYEAK